jgi:membrane protease YdiL (CAAX protease family)
MSLVLAAFGAVFLFFGFRLFSTSFPLIPAATLLPWESAIYGAVLLGWALTLILVGRIAFRRQDVELKRALFVGLGMWLAVEALASAWLGVWFNVGVDVAVCALFAVPLLARPRA